MARLASWRDKGGTLPSRSDAARRRQQSGIVSNSKTSHLPVFAEAFLCVAQMQLRDRAAVAVVEHIIGRGVLKDMGI